MEPNRARDYVQLAVSVLNSPDPAKTNTLLREWAVDLLNNNSPTRFSPEVVKRLKSGESSFDDRDPIGISGVWTYTTDLTDNNTYLNGRNGFKGFMGINTIISVDKDGYRMEGKRTHFKREGSNTFEPYSNPKEIVFSRISYSPAKDKFYFYENGSKCPAACGGDG